MDAKQILGQWPNRDAIAADLGVPNNLIRTWHHRNRIPAEWYGPIIDSARRHDLPVTFEILARHRKPARQPDEAA